MSEEHTLGDGPIDQQYVDQMTSIARRLDAIFNGEYRGQKRETGFIPLVFPFNDHGGRCNYISNGADRRDVCALLREQIARFEEMPTDVGHG